MSSETKDAPPVADAVLAAVRAPRRRPVLVAFVGLAAVAGGAFGRQALLPVKSGAPAAEAVANEPPEPPPPAETVANKADLLLRSGRFADAAALLAAAPADAFPSDRLRHYRVGLAREGLRQWAAAEAAYRLAAGPDSDPGEWARAQLGRARVAAGRGDGAAARAVVNRVLLTSGDPACRNVLAECLHLRGRFAVLALHPPTDPDPLDDSVPAWPRLNDGVNELLDWMPAERSPRSPDLADPPDPPLEVQVRRYGWLPVPPRVTARGPTAPTAEWVARVAVAGGWGLDIAPAAAARLAAAPPVRVDVEAAPAAEVLGALLEPLGLTAVVGGPDVVVRPAAAADRDAAQAAARRATALAPDHPAGRALTLAAVNLDFEAGRAAAAAGGYRRFLDEGYFSPEALLAVYNLGLIDLRAGNQAGARTRFLDVIDREPDGRWGAIGWWWVARSYLDTADTRPARAPLARARAAARPEVASAALLGTALADYLDGNDGDAVPVVRATRFPDLPAHRLSAEWFRALARYRAAPSELRGKELQEATEAAGNGRPFGPVGVFFAGRLYRETGRADRMAALYDVGSAEGSGPVALRMTFDVAEYLYRRGDRAGARHRFLVVAAVDPGGLGPRAEVRLADLAARAGLGAECVARCRRAAGGPGVDEAELLRVMGGGYEILGQRLRAAECFAGRVPAE